LKSAILKLPNSTTKIEVRREMFCSPCGVVCEPDSFFCHACGCTVNVTEGSRNDIDDIITYYFYRGYQYSAIVGLLKKHQGAQILEREEPGG
jgi:hypothetical protein